MNRTAFLCAAGSALAAGLATRPVQAAGESAISLVTSTGTIAGTLTLPAKSPAPVVLVVAGSGPVDRNGNSGPIQAGTYALLASALATEGIASVRYDKRGVGASASALAAEKDLRLQTYSDDVAGWLRLLRSDPRFTRVVVAGHSEGSLLAMIAAQTSPADAFVSLEGAGRPAAAVLREQLKPKISPQWYARADAIVSQLEQGHLVPNVPPGLAALFRLSVQPYLISWFKDDPAVEIGKLRIPVTIVQGTADIQVTMTDANDLKKGAPSARLVVVDGMNHMLKYAPDTSSMAVVLKGYEDPSLPVDPQAVEAVSSAARFPARTAMMPSEISMPADDRAVKALGPQPRRCRFDS